MTRACEPSGLVGGLLFWIMNCAPRVATMSRMSICHQSALKCQTLDPFRAVNDAVGPFIRHFRMQKGFQNAFLDLSSLCAGGFAENGSTTVGKSCAACRCQLSASVGA